MRFRLNPPALLLAVLLGFGLFWWVGKPFVDSFDSDNSAPAPKLHTPSKPVEIKSAPARPAQVAAPVLKPAPVMEPQPATALPAAPADPRLNLVTAMADFLQMVDSGDYLAATKTYLQLPADVPPEQFLAQLQQSPDFPQLVQMAQDTMRATQGLTPDYNDAGDQATYTLTPPVDGKTIVRWKKVGDQWFLDGLDN